MCGIGALLDPAGSFADDVPARMTDALRHRGPDGEGACRIGPASLIHTRLAIIDVEGGDQPLVSEDRSVTTVVNGEIYNHKELRAELEAEGHRFATRSDCEVIVHLYERDGLECVRRLNGIFAFALWDDRAQRLVVARDHLGVKPLYWWSDGRRVVVSSEIGGLLATGVVERRLDPIALEHFLAWRFVPAPRTMLAGVAKLAAGELLVADSEGMRTASFREPPGESLAAPEAELEAELQREFVAAVERQMMSDVPYGAFLSGGLDSAAIVAAMRRAAPFPPRTFTIGFPGHGAAIDERVDAATTARLLGTEHSAETLEASDFSAVLDACVERLEEPCGIPSAPALLQLSHFARRSVKVALSGQGADEPLAGYPRHQAAAALMFATRLPVPLGRACNRAARLLPRNERAKRAASLLGNDPSGHALLRIFEIAPADLRAELSGGPALEAATERRELTDAVLADVGDRDELERMLYLDTHVFLPDGLLIYGDKMSMAASLEQRVPFLDLELMRLVERIPARLRLRRLRRKWLYKRALNGLVPDEVLHRRKRPFATPYDDWLRRSLGDEVERRYSRGSAMAEHLAPAIVARLVAEHRSGRADHKRVLYCLLELARWHERFIEQRARVSSALI
jgi:asparagine synthase (glutamine-hydrolysing)